MTEDKPKRLRISYDWRGMPVEFLLKNTGSSGDTLYGIAMMYDGAGRRVSKTRMHNSGNGIWDTTQVTHYTGIGTEIRERVNMPVFFRVTLTRLKPRSYIEKDILRLSNGGAILPKQSFGASRQGLGRYGIENADGMAKGDEFYLKNHLGSTMMVAQVSSTNASEPAKVAAAYDYRAFGEQVTLKKSADKVTENFTGKEKDDETELNYFGARYLDPMLGMWTSVDPARQFASPYLYVGNGVNPMNGVDSDGKDFDGTGLYVAERMSWGVSKTNDARVLRAMNDPDRLFRFAEDCSGDSYIRLSSDPDPDYKKTYDVYVSGVADDEFSVITQILVGHELDHPYEFANPGHNALESVYSERDYYDGIKRMSEETKPDPIYKHDYDSAKEFGVYDE